MSGKKGMKKYPMAVRKKIVQRIQSGDSQRALSRECSICFGSAILLTSGLEVSSIICALLWICFPVKSLLGICQTGQMVSSSLPS